MKNIELNCLLFLALEFKFTSFDSKRSFIFRYLTDLHNGRFRYNGLIR